jgi:hypothetical protein
MKVGILKTSGMMGLLLSVAFLGAFSNSALIAAPQQGECSSSGCNTSGPSVSKAMGTKDAGTIVDVAVSAGTFNTLVTAVKAAGLVRPPRATGGREAEGGAPGQLKSLGTDAFAASEAKARLWAVSSCKGGNA